MASSTRNTIVHPSIQRDRSHRWHPQLEVRDRGQVVYAITGLKPFLSSWRAQQEADSEALRFVQRANA